MGEPVRVDLDETSWNLSFPCPECGDAIHLEDRIGRDFDLLQIEMEEEKVQEAVIQCRRCKRIIRLNGLGTISRIGNFDE